MTMAQSRPIVPCEGKHGRKQRIVTRFDGARVQVCERCNAVIAVITPAHHRQWTDAELLAEAKRRQKEQHSRPIPPNPNEP